MSYIYTKKIVPLHFIKPTKKSSLFYQSRILYFIFLFILFSFSSLAQTNNQEEKELEVLIKKNYSFLKATFWKVRVNSIEESRLYAEAYLLKAKKDNKIKEKADAYFMLIYSIDDKKKQFQYADSIITLTKDNINFNQPADAYILKANQYATEGNYKEAFNQLEKANSCTNISGNKYQIYHIKYLIARLKTDIGDYESSLSLLKDLISYEKSINNITGQIVAYSAYANNLNFLKKTDSAIVISKKAIALSLKRRKKPPLEEDKGLEVLL